ncbi:hypothetical protein RIEGSTA812A_PEG_174 [invertebrate metagenome]|uniref:Uncharacterized protein n=1 Tax=invertebrate metagenome TaxID=1711999 RepID=A0A484H5S9_9ZZZZ
MQCTSAYAMGLMITRSDRPFVGALAVLRKFTSILVCARSVVGVFPMYVRC